MNGDSFMTSEVTTLNKKERNKEIAIRYFLNKEKQTDIAKDYGLDQSMVHYVIKDFKQDRRFREEFITEADVKLALAAPKAADKLIETSERGESERLALDATKAILARNINLGGEKAPVTVNIGQIQALIAGSLGYDTTDKQANGRSVQEDDDTIGVQPTDNTHDDE